MSWFRVIADSNGPQPNKRPRNSLETRRYAEGWIAEHPGRKVWIAGPYATQREARSADVESVRRWRNPINHQQAAA